MPDPDALRFPIGPMPALPATTPQQQARALTALQELPKKLTTLVGAWPDTYLDTPYRPGGWTARQVVHHLADSHLNAYLRTRLALTETNPTICPYDEAAWALLPDSALSVAPSLTLLSSLHLRWTTCLGQLTNEQWQRTYYHPGTRATYSLAHVLALYAWHGEHHYQHVFRLAGRNGWLG